VSGSIYSKLNNWENENLIRTQLPAHVTITFPPSCGGTSKNHSPRISMQTMWFQGSCWRHHILHIMTDTEEGCIKTRACEQWCLSFSPNPWFLNLFFKFLPNSNSIVHNSAHTITKQLTHIKPAVCIIVLVSIQDHNMRVMF